MTTIFTPPFTPQFGNAADAAQSGSTRTPLVVANLALMKLGSGPLQTFSASTPAGAAVATLYPHVVRGIFGEYPWNFAKQTVLLAQLAAPVLDDGLLPSGWQNAFQLPGEMIGPPSRILANNRWPDNPETRFELQGTTVYTNQLALWAIGTMYVDESAWPDHFAAAVVDSLAAELCPVVTGANLQMIQRLELKAWGTPEQNRCGGSLGQAKLIDARNQPSRILAHNPLIDVRTASISVIPTGATYP